jgi:dolichyl-phosphate beta-glucosyltransferase
MALSPQDADASAISSRSWLSPFGSAPAGRIRRDEHELSVVIPAYNEASRLPATLDALAEYLADWGVDYRVLVVDDGSRDETAELVECRGRAFSVIRQPNAGKGAAVRNGILQSTGRIVAFTDADLPYHLDGLRAAYDAVCSGAVEVGFGARDLKDSATLAPRRLVRRAAHETFRRIVTALVSRQVTDTQCGLKVFSRRAAIEIFSRTTINGFAFDAEVVYLTHALGLPFDRVPVVLINEYGSTISLARHALPMLIDVLRLRLRALAGRYQLGEALVSPLAVAEAPSMVWSPSRAEGGRVAACAE